MGICKLQQNAGANTWEVNPPHMTHHASNLCHNLEYLGFYLFRPPGPTNRPLAEFKSDESSHRKFLIFGSSQNWELCF